MLDDDELETADRPALIAELRDLRAKVAAGERLWRQVAGVPGTAFARHEYTVGSVHVRVPGSGS